MADDSGVNESRASVQSEETGTGLGLAVALGALAAIGAGIAIQQIIRRRLSKPEMNRLKFYRYLRERGHLES